MSKSWYEGLALADIHTTQAYIHAVTKDSGLTVQFKDNIPAPYTTKNTICIPTISNRMTKKDSLMLRQFVLHETLHHTEGKTIFKTAHDLGMADPARSEDAMAAMWNIFEDGRIEREGAKKYRGDAKILSDGDNLTLNQVAPKFKQIDPEDKEMNALCASIIASVEDKAKWSQGAALALPNMLANANKTTLDMVQKLKDKGIQDGIESMSGGEQGVQDSLNLAKQAFELLLEKSAEEHMKEMKEKADKKGKGKGEKGEGEEGDGEEEGKGKDGGEYGRGDDSESVWEDKRRTVKFKELAPSDHDPSKKTGATGMHLDYTDHIGSGKTYVPTPYNKLRWLNYKTGKTSHSHLHTSDDGESWQIEKYTRYKERHGNLGKGFANKIRRLLQIKSRSRYLGGQKKGKIHGKNLPRAAMNAGSYSERVFKTKVTSDTLDTAVCVLCDASGSMGGDKYSNAIMSATLLNSSISTSLGIPLEVLTFSEEGSNTTMGIIKNYSDRSSNIEIEKNMLKFSDHMSGNADGEAILFAYNRLAKRPEKRKVFIVLSDGSPAGWRDGDLYGFTKNVIKDIEKDKAVDIMGIGIEDNNVKALYKDSQVINRPEQLEAALLNVIKRKVL